ncbi:MAG: hypothetical protein ACFFEN_06740 [Candidatus Thorarchaeota archaeon]
MAEKIYICRECGYAFPSQLTSLIKQKIQVYCERCGSPFILEGVSFKPAPTPIRKHLPSIAITKKKSSGLGRFIKFLNNVSFIPILIFTIVSFALISEIAFNWENWFFILGTRFLQGLIGLFLLIYDRSIIAPKVRQNRYNEIFLESILWGLLGCVHYGIGVIILLKGVFIFIYVITNGENRDLKAYDYGLLAKDSFNEISNKAGFLTILIGIYIAFSNKIYIPKADSMVFRFFNYLNVPLIVFLFLGLLITSIIALLIDKRSKNEIRIKNKFETKYTIKIIIIGIVGTVFYAAGIFILLKGILLFFLSFGKPSEVRQVPFAEEKPVYPIQEQEKVELEEKKEVAEEPIPEPEYKEHVIEPEHKEPVIEPEHKEPIIEPEQKEPIIEAEPLEQERAIKQEKDVEKEFEKSEEEEATTIKMDKEQVEEAYELKLHDSLLPVKDEKDKKLVKQYFSKIFAVLSKDLRKEIKKLKISKKEKKELLQELAFLTKEEQAKYVESLAELYKEIPKKLIERIRKLPNVRPEHYNKIVEQLKYMDALERINFVQFLEENA